MAVRMSSFNYGLYILLVLWTIGLLVCAEKEPAEPQLHEGAKLNLESSTENAVVSCCIFKCLSDITKIFSFLDK